ncbi:MAG: C4-type zinc ribbon domain-containing protein [Prevotellaceae bacterium]|jgi:predicted  nucleic acid-binding Zn-ribbon protein|nr:C4-type zinc ribbon domain-containing protein [Prevotellaceae bacterium]
MATKTTATKSKTYKKATQKPEKQEVKPTVKVASDNTDKDLTVEEKLSVLYNLQKIVSKIDDIKTLRGDLPLEVQDLEDELVGLNTRLNKFNAEVKEMNAAIGQRKHEIEESRVKIQKYKTQQDNVRNNREFDNLSKEIEFQTLEVELSEKRIREFTVEKERREAELTATNDQLKERKIDLKVKKGELEEIVTETKQGEDVLRDEAKDLETKIEPRLLTAFKRIRKNARNGLAIVTVQRDACGGCFNKIPAQRQLDIRQRKKIIVCEYCGRILIDKELVGEE